jgi:hypothetical protein
MMRPIPRTNFFPVTFPTQLLRLKLWIALTLLAGLCLLTPAPALAQGNGNGVAGRVSALEQRADAHDAQLAELHSSVAAIGAQVTASLKLVGMKTQNTELEPTPTPLSNGISEYLTDPLVTVPVPASATRTHLFLIVGAAYQWHQVVSDQRYRFGDAVVTTIKSAALTNAGLASDTIGFAIGSELQLDDAASGVGVTRLKDRTWPVGLDINVVASLFNGTLGERAEINGQPVTDVQALQIAAAVMHSSMEIQVKVRARARSVDSFVVSQGTVQVWADGN